MKNVTVLLIVGVSLITICVSFFVIPYYVSQTSSYWYYDNSTGVIGDTIGGIVGPVVGFIGVVLTFLAFYVQYDANKVQRTALYMEQFESKFFELLRLHRENLKTLEANGQHGIKFFEKLSNDLNISLDKAKTKSSGKFTDDELIIIVFYVFYYGSETSTRSAIRNKLFKADTHPNDPVLRSIYAELTSQLDKDGNFKFQGQFSVLLDNYFNMLFLLLKFCHRHVNQTDATDIQLPNKDFYVDTIVAQFSVFEATILFFYLQSGFDQRVLTPINLVNEFGLLDKLFLQGIKGVNAKDLFTKLKA
ncbi:MAG: putative phage abortive infection protein [Flavobacteriales bacterium]|nr:putative phage abortive infection protein [Flavobacteriales bacterium]